MVTVMVLNACVDEVEICVGESDCDILADKSNAATVCMVHTNCTTFYNLVIKNTLLICCAVDCM
jgi:hypothetical protein